MLILDTPISLGSHSYTRLSLAKGTWDMRARTLEIVISVAREKAGKTVVATKEEDGDRHRLICPPAIATLLLQDSTPADPALMVVFQKLHELNEAIEAVLIVEEKLDGQVYQVGEEEIALVATYAPGEPPEIEEKIKAPKP